MKQSTKLLSLLLALIMAFSCMSVIGNAELVKEEVAYDSLDDSMQMSKNTHQIYTTFPIEKGSLYMYNKIC